LVRTVFISRDIVKPPYLNPKLEVGVLGREEGRLGWEKKRKEEEEKKKNKEEENIGGCIQKYPD
jgi:hypothetical protein